MNRIGQKPSSDSVFLFSANNKMSRLLSDVRYREGKCDQLDQKWKRYKMMRAFSGEAWSQSLTQEEIDILAEIWRKKT